MARGIQNYPNIKAPDVDYPNGDIRDKTPVLPGTPVDKTVYSDMHQFFAKLLRLAQINANGLPENEYSGFQYIEALKIVSNPFLYLTGTMSQTGTNPPVISETRNEIGPYLPTRNAVGEYFLSPLGTLPIDTNVLGSAFCVGGSSGPGFATFTVEIQGSDRVIVIRTFNSSLSPSDGILFDASIQATMPNPKR